MPMQRLARLVVAAVLAVSSAASVRGQESELFANENRFYLAPIVGASWGTLIEDGDPVIGGNLFTAGGAAGVAYARDRGQLRLEFESRYRDNFGISQDVLGIPASLETIDNWSTMVNAWRDFTFTDRLGIYGGGGIGAGGYGLNPSISFANDALIGSNRITAFAWQVGCGVLYALHERITLDVGYRFYSVGAGNTTLTLVDNGTPLESAVYSTSFAASEMLLSLRIYEPFRSWR